MAPKYSFRADVEEFIGTSLLSLLIDLVVRMVMVGVTVYLEMGGVTRIDEIPSDLRYKYSYPFLDKASQVFPVPKLMLWVFVLAGTLFLLNHLVLYFLGSPLRKVGVDLYHFMMSSSLIVLSILITVGFLKHLVARPRPDFIARCFPEGPPKRWRRNPVCTRPLEDLTINDGLQSFPSGHSAVAWATASFCFLYLREHYRQHSHHVPSRVPRCIPFLIAFCLGMFACYVSCSRLIDFQHHAEDVIAGGLIGLFFAYICFYIYYPIHSFQAYKEPSFSSEHGFYDDRTEVDSAESLLDDRHSRHT